MSVDLCGQNNQRAECLLYVVFFGSSTGLRTGHPHVIQRLRTKTTKWSSEGQNLTNLRSEIQKVRGKTEVELITCFGKHRSRSSKLFKDYRVLQVSGHSSPA